MLGNRKLLFKTWKQILSTICFFFQDLETNFELDFLKLKQMTILFAIITFTALIISFISENCFDSEKMENIMMHNMLIGVGVLEPYVETNQR